jgi:transcriptional regulator with XRE-family HTH domain
MLNKQFKSAQRESELFAERLSHALTAAGMDISASALQHAFNEHSSQPSITIHAERKWLLGESIPTHARLQALAGILGVSASWLRFGETVLGESSKAISTQEQLLINNYRKLGREDRGHISAIVRSLAKGR